MFEQQKITKSTPMQLTLPAKYCHSTKAPVLHREWLDCFKYCCSRWLNINLPHVQRIVCAKCH